MYETEKFVRAKPEDWDNDIVPKNDEIALAFFRYERVRSPMGEVMQDLLFGQDGAPEKTLAE